MGKLSPNANTKLSAHNIRLYKRRNDKSLNASFGRRINRRSKRPKSALLSNAINQKMWKQNEMKASISANNIMQNEQNKLSQKAHKRYLNAMTMQNAMNAHRQRHHQTLHLRMRSKSDPKLSKKQKRSGNPFKIINIANVNSTNSAISMSISETPIPTQMNHSMKICAINAKKTTISSMDVPPPPSPQLIQMRMSDTQTTVTRTY